ncbi:ATP-dependent DNA helicase RecG [Prosthecomicrobium hirschii]|uniref:ATP-dependent DNA helicase RecG n=1 Tax=Prosthecodimorpha hirschii TaxID=665126 RepID=UPI0011299F40|nr:ATP-dependent DNA helicase RecG [Prosthecomicrobium hirschii]TPQ49638.1 ATP-dependent DNA helicase RecG [Prosthecomicrobium hirschii]
MRPDVLTPLFAAVSGLPGVGPKTAKLFDRLLGAEEGGIGARLVDLVFHVPTGIVDRRLRPGVARAPEGAIVTLDLHIDRHRPPPPGSRAPYKIFAYDDTGEIALTFFHAKADWLEKLLPEGERRWVSGRVEWFNGAPQMAHPDHVVPHDRLDEMPAVEPVYPLTEGLSAKLVGRAVAAALARLPDLPEWQDAEWLRQRRFPDFATALTRLHHPDGEDGQPAQATALARLAYDELLAGQLALAIVRRDLRRRPKPPRAGDGRLVEAVRSGLPFALTGAQARAVAEIAADMARPERMVRLLQGDVGSGKTVVGLLAAAHAAESGGQTAFMAPTELLARQHFRTIAALARAGGLGIAILTGREKGREREAILAGLADGSIAIAVGTHALFQEGVEFRDLALAVVDEQHRFGVHQRLALTQKGRGTDLLIMTATPIPRTLMMSSFGDVDVSRLDEKPAGRQPIATRAVPTERIGEVVDGLSRAMAGGARVYWVCPLVEESEAIDLAAASDRARDLEHIFGPVVGLVHGRMKGAEKDEVMRRFAAGELSVLVATTVIEVGVDVPEATVMVIEHAERFGLSQLHQLRGRVGRGSAASTCLLLYRGPLGETARARLAIMRETEDGFRIAEEDLRLRGGGEILGTRQSGLPGFRLARLELHGELMEAARDDARLILARDPDLTTPRGTALRTLLYLFGRDEGIRLLGAG